MAYCTNCGQQLPDGSKFCSNCGNPTTTKNEQRRTIYEGELHKCPNCGELLDSFTTHCSSCDYEIRGAKATSSVRQLAEKLEFLELNRKETKHSSVIGMLYGNDGQTNTTDEQKITLIRSFAIPNTKEDIAEFMILASSNIDLKLYGLGDQGILTASKRAVSDAWLAKFDQAYEKAKFTFGESKDFRYINEIYEKKQKQLTAKKREVPMLVIGMVVAMGLLALFMLLVIQSAQ